MNDAMGPVREAPEVGIGTSQSFAGPAQVLARRYWTLSNQARPGVLALQALRYGEGVSGMDKFRRRQAISNFVVKMAGTDTRRFSVAFNRSLWADRLFKVHPEGADAPEPLEPGAGGRKIETLLHAMVLGVDQFPRPLDPAEIMSFGDVFSQQLILKGLAPLTLGELVAALENIEGEGQLTKREMFVVAEGAALRPANADFDLNTRLVYVWRRDEAAKPDVMLSTVPSPDDPTSLLQLIAWSESGGTFHFFERDSQRGLGWMWAGSSRHSLQRPSRGKGPFDSHVNGSLVMKELKFPWVHWHSQRNNIPRRLVFPDPEHPLFSEVTNAEELEAAVKQGVRRWTDRRIDADTRQGRLHNLSQYTRQILTTTTVNLVSTEATVGNVVGGPPIRLPASFFLDVDAFARLLADLDGATWRAPEFVVQPEPYIGALRSLKVHVRDSEGHSVPGDTHFAFVVPERAFEDDIIVDRMVENGVIPARLMLCALMVDFPNPILSERRASLSHHFPSTAATSDCGKELVAGTIGAISALHAGPNSPQQELLTWWEMGDDLTAHVRAALDAYASAVNDRLSKPEGVEEVLRLAESRRQRFRRRPLGEFPHSTARISDRITRLVMTRSGTVVRSEE